MIVHIRSEQSSRSTDAATAAGYLSPGSAELDRLARWLHEHVGTETGLVVRQIPGGLSNLTYEIRDAAGRRIVLRRPPLAYSPGGAHDVLREYRVLQALAGTPVPVPRPLAGCSDDAVLGVPFLVTDWVEGLGLPDEASAAALNPAARERVGVELATILATLHGLDVRANGLESFARPEPYLQRELRRWSRIWTHNRGAAPDPFAAAAARLVDAAPRSPRVGLVHGDPHVRNILIAPSGEIVALLDWEMCTVGDPLADLALALAYWHDPADELPPAGSLALTAPGFIDREDFVRAYEQAAGRPCDGLDYYVAFATWKLAAIIDSAAWREQAAHAAAGESATEDAELKRLKELTALLAERAERLTRSDLS